MMAAPALPWCLPLTFLLLLATPSASTAVGDPGQLTCFYNSKANVSCEWTQEGSLPNTSCHIHARSNQRTWTKTCELIQVRQTAWACDLILGRPKSQSLTSADLVNISVVCGAGESRRVVNTQDFKPFSNLRLVAPSSLQVIHVGSRRCNISWEVVLVSHYIQRNLEFQVRTRSAGERWEDVPLLDLKQRQQWICLETLRPDTQYELQVRARAQRDNSKEWSPWSAPLAFRTKPAAGSTRQEAPPLSWLVHAILGVCGAFGFFFIVYSLVYYRTIMLWLKKALKYHIPDPSQFFPQMSSEHRGDFQKWLSSPFPSSAFSPAGPVPEISPLEVLDRDAKAAQLLLQHKGAPPLPPTASGHSLASCFTNQGYFFLHLLDALEIEACQVYFTYDPCEQEPEAAVPGAPAPAEAAAPGAPAPAGAPLPLLCPVSGDDDAYCTLPPGDELLPSCPTLPCGPSPPHPALGGSRAWEEKGPPSLREGLLGDWAPPTLGPSGPGAPPPVSVQPPSELAQGEAGEGVPAPNPEQGAVSSWVGPPGQDQTRALTSGPALNTDVYLTLQDLPDQDPAHIV
ncbi:interleukin-2 receptor subunit beta [Lepus europaeus]|uniref:interleukin-2 receptor subunit beta n=1 Tax=Lepus europaeus TaxID=9983 RepID=UPI002B47D958|nr:interleukin-2 receptor subunit beta [Lepus europaeus]